MATAEPLSYSNQRWGIVALSLVTLAGLALRLTNIGESLWLDELHTGWVVKDAWGDVAWRAQIGNQSPLWFYAVKLITTLGGESELTLRLLSLVAGTALIPTVYLLVCHWLASAEAATNSPPAPDSIGTATTTSALPALLAAALIAVDPNCIFYATEARPYACLQLCSAVQLGLFLQILQAPTTKLRIGWILLTALAFHLHYTGILILLGELVVLLGYYLLSPSAAPYRAWRALFDWQIAVMLCLPAIGHVLEVAQRRGMWDSMSGRPEWSDLLTIFPLYPLTEFGFSIYPVFLLVGIAAALAVGQCLRGWAAAKPQASWAALLLITIWLVIPLLAAFGVAYYDVARIFLRRYLIAFAIGPPLLMALLISRLPRCWLQGIVAAALLCLAIQQSGIIAQLRYDGRAVGDRNEDWRGAIAALNNSLKNEPLPVLISAGLIEEAFVYHNNDDSPETMIPNRARVFEYLTFPLRSCYRLNAQGLEIKSAAQRDSEAVAIPFEELEWPRAPNVWLIARERCEPFGRGIEYVRTRSEPMPYGDVILGKARAYERAVTSPQSQSSNP